VQAAPTSWHARWARLLRGSQPGRFRLTQYFTITSLVAFGVVGIALYFLERAEGTFFEGTVVETNTFFAHAQAELLGKQKAAARANLLAQHEASHVNLARVIANAVWEQRFAPLVARAQAVPVERCRGAAERQSCYAGLGRQVRALPGFAAADDAVHAMTAGTGVFKTKVYDLRGLTVYSSEAAQVGEDKSDNAGWLAAARGRPASELVHRDRFSSFEGEVENRDLIQSYLPVFVAGDVSVLGVFEIYSDVTPLLRQIDAYTASIEGMAAANQAQTEATARSNQRKVDSSSAQHFVILGGLLALLYMALWVLVRYAQSVIDEQARARQHAAIREQAAYREKMAALATMAANASHDIGNPLAVIAGLADELERARGTGGHIGPQPAAILEQADRIAEMSRRITQFASARSETPEPVDLNQMVASVCQFLAFDDRYRGIRIETRLAPQLPACIAIPEHLNEVLMGLLGVHAETAARAGARGRIVVSTAAVAADVALTIACECDARTSVELPAADPRLESARTRVAGMGGRLGATATRTTIVLPALRTPQPA